MIAAVLLATFFEAASAPQGPRSSPDPAVAAKLEEAFRGTIVSTYEDGRSGRLLLNPDHTYRYSGRTGAKSGGTWALNGGEDKICLKQKRPLAIPLGYCTPIPSGKTWKAKAAGGEPVTLHVAPGRAG